MSAFTLLGTPIAMAASASYYTRLDPASIEMRLHGSRARARARRPGPLLMQGTIYPSRVCHQDEGESLRLGALGTFKSGTINAFFLLGCTVTAGLLCIATDLTLATSDTSLFARTTGLSRVGHLSFQSWLSSSLRGHGLIPTKFNVRPTML